MRRRTFLSFAALLTALVATTGFLAFRDGPDTHEPLNASLELARGSLDGEDSPGRTPSNHDLSAHRILSRVVLLLKENYVEPERIRPYEMFMAALDYIQKTIAEVIVDDSTAPRQITVVVGQNSRTFDLERLGGLDQLWEVTLALREIFQFLEQHIDSEQHQEIEYNAINGMLSTLDPHSILLKPESFNEVKLATRGEFGGLGIVISIRDGALTVISPIEGTPASRAGLRAKDHIVKIDEESTVNMALEEAVQLLRGKPGSPVNIWVKRKKWPEPKKFPIVRAIIKIESVRSRLLDDGVGYVRIKNFQQNTYDDLKSHLDELREKHGKELKGLVVDLRDNPGGLLDQAILVSDQFIEDGALVITVGEGNRRRDEKIARSSGTEANYPIVALVNSGSASASEIVSGALKNHDRGVVIGQQTFGKGSVQVLYDFKNKAALKLTIAQYLTPGDVSIQSVGIAPDVALVPAVISDEEIHAFKHEESTREKDLDRHLNTFDSVQSDRRAATKSSETIVHLLEDETEEEVEEPAPDAFNYDFEIRLAHEVLKGTEGATRPEVLAGAKSLFQEIRQREQDKIVTRLSKLGIDWSAAPSADVVDASKLQATLRVSGATKSGVFVAGSEVTLEATLVNNSSKTMYRTFAYTESENPFLARREFVFGKLGPNETRKWKVKTKLPSDMSPRADDVILKFETQTGPVGGLEPRELVEVRASKKPLFAFSYRIDDRPRGNGDGVLQVGEEVQVAVDVSNLGDAVAEKVQIALKNQTGPAVYLKEGRAKLGALKPRGKASATLKFSVREPEDDVSLRLSVWDSTLGSVISDVLAIPVRPAQKAKRRKLRLRVDGSEPIDVLAGADKDSFPIATAKPGSVLRSSAQFGDWHRVSLGGNAIGFVAASDVAPLRGKKVGKGGGVLRVPGVSAPKVALDIPNLVTKNGSLKVQGVVSDRDKLQDMFAFVNDKKVFFHGLKAIERKDPKKPLSYRFAFDAELNEGSNKVVIVVRKSDDLMTRKSYGFYRRLSHPVVAEKGK